MPGRRFVGVSLLLTALAAAAVTSCNRSVDVKDAIEVIDASSGWFDAGIVDGKNKVVPSVTFKLRKKPDADLSVIALNVAFRYVPGPGSNVEEPWEDFFVQRAEFKNGNETDPLVVRLPNGYTGEPPQSRLEMLKNSQFRDVRARIFAKYSGAQWVEIGSIDVQRQLIVR
jgi:hypothetical protein